MSESVFDLLASPPRDGLGWAEQSKLTTSMRIHLLNSEWRKWFAWRPVVTRERVIVWLEWVERKVWADNKGNVAVEYRIPEQARAHE